MTLKATNFMTPLMRVLGQLSGFRPDIPVAAVDTYQPVMALMGIKDINEYGDHKTTKQPMVVKWIQWANKEARTAGLTTAPPKTRGKWCLTAGGVTEAIRLEGAATALTPPVAAPPVPVATVTPPVAPVVVAAPVTPVRIPQVTSAYHKDAYIRSLACEATSCSGKYSNHGAAACATCPLAADCQNMQMSHFSRLALVLKEQDAKREANINMPPRPPTAPVPPPYTATKKGHSRFDNVDFSEAEVIVNKAKSVCESCGEPIRQNERARWLEEIPGTDDGGLFHLDCSGGE